jgi:hypothetical protein
MLFIGKNSFNGLREYRSEPVENVCSAVKSEIPPEQLDIVLDVSKEILDVGMDWSVCHDFEFWQVEVDAFAAGSVEIWSLVLIQQLRSY